MVKKIFLLLISLFLISVLAAFLSIKSAQKSPAPEITANFTDLNKIEKISRYRSCAGHITVPQDGREAKRNMKHYFWVKPQYNKPKTVEIYSPYDGYVADMRSDPKEGLEGEIWISTQKIFAMVPPFGVWSFSVQHIDIKDSLKRGDKVKAGDLIGWAALSEKRGDSFDIVYGKSGMPPKRIDNWTDPFADLDSVFSHMNSSAFADYTKKGIHKEELIISREERDKNPCEYQGEGPYFTNQEDPDNWVILP